MSTERRAVLVGADGSAPSDLAVAWAADEAARTGRSLRLVHVVETAMLDVPARTTDGIVAELTEAGSRILRDAEALALRRQPRLVVETEAVHEPDVPSGLRRFAGESAAVVVGHRGRGGFTGLLLGSTGLRLTGTYPGPVVVVRDRADITADEVVAGVDLVEDPAPVLDYAFATAAAREAPLRVVHARQPAPLAVEARVDRRNAEETTREHLTSVLAPWRDRYPDVKVAEEVFVGHPVDALATASANAGLVVVGSRERNIPLGSVSHGVLHHARGPVAVVRSYT
ncbi:universal stress protein [Actinomadura sp. 6K520]|uniref:universal stress protein n=1 Tax=Actinomadura sp. 6K520 TaxID=2530364 RepID=UPI001046B5E6|nr:universal stress protein [Actinomadura sp. 6K520]TDE36807.1 universal stress protein [Actinomadura sp. 6K520]